jgi:SPP1 gp7 family putative phage head morphogenesis protein
MPTPEQLSRDFQAAVESLNDVALRRMASELAAILPGLVAEAERTAARVQELRAAGKPAEAAAYSAQRARAIAQQMEAEVRRIMAHLRPELLNGQQAAISAGLETAQRLTEASLPEGLTLRRLAALGAPWRPASIEAVQALIGGTSGGPVGDLLDALGTDAGRRAREALVSGLAAGKNPRAVGRVLQREAVLSATRAQTISRTEILRAYRTANAVSYARNPDIVKGFRRLAAKSARTCPMCLALDGTFQETSTMLAVHPNDRCTVVPEVVSFRDLGIPVDDPVRERESGAQWFARQPTSTQAAILGPGGLAKYKGGAPLSAFTRVVDDPDWGPTLRRAPLSEVA